MGNNRRKLMPIPDDNRVYWCYGCASPYHTVGNQRRACKAWVGNRKMAWTPKWYADDIRERRKPWFHRRFGHALLVKTMPGDVIVCEAPEIIFQSADDAIRSIEALRSKGVHLEFINSRFDLDTDEGLLALNKEIGREWLLYARNKIRKKKDRPLGWNYRLDSYSINVPERLLGAFVYTLIVERNISWKDISIMVKRLQSMSYIMKACICHAANWPKLPPKKVGMQMLQLSQQLKISEAEKVSRKSLRGRVRACLINGPRSLAEIAEHLGLSKGYAYSAMGPYLTKKIITKTKDASGILVFSWDDARVEQLRLDAIRAKRERLAPLSVAMQDRPQDASGLTHPECHQQVASPEQEDQPACDSQDPRTEGSDA